MLRRAIAVGLIAWLAATGALAQKDQSRLGLDDAALAQATDQPAPAAPAPPETGAAPEPPATDEPAPETGGEDELSLGEIPIIQALELTPDSATRAIEALALVKEKYKDANLEDYENLQDYVDQGSDGKTFDADIKSFGFKDVTEWNTTILSVGFAYSVLLNDDTADIKQQIEEIKSDTALAQDMKDRMIASLTASIPSENNKKVVADLMKDPTMAAKLKLLDEEPAGE
jgi:hypothetical protein